MVAKSPKKLTKKGQQTQEKVIRAGIECIARQGFHAASTNRIAEAAGVTWGTLQHQFGDKATLLEAIIDFAHKDQLETLEQRTSAAHPLAQRVDEVIEALWDMHTTQTSLALNDIVSSVLSDDSLRHRLLPSLQEVRDRYDGFWQNLFADTGLKPEQFEIAKQFTIATVRGLVADRAMRSSETPIIAAKEQLKHWLVHYMNSSRESASPVPHQGN